MSGDDTRDIAVRSETLLATVITELAAVRADVASLKAEFHQRQGADRMAKWIIGLFSSLGGGGFVVGLLKAFPSFFGALPK